MKNYVHKRWCNYVLTLPPVFGRKWPKNRCFYYIIKKKKKKKKNKKNIGKKLKFLNGRMCQ